MKPLKLQDTMMCLDCEALFAKGPLAICPVCGGTAIWSLKKWIPAMDGMEMVTGQRMRPRQIHPWVQARNAMLAWRAA